MWRRLSNVSINQGKDEQVPHELRNARHRCMTNIHRPPSSDDAVCEAWQSWSMGNGMRSTILAVPTAREGLVQHETHSELSF